MCRLWTPWLRRGPNKSEIPAPKEGDPDTFHVIAIGATEVPSVEDGERMVARFQRRMLQPFQTRITHFEGHVSFAQHFISILRKCANQPDKAPKLVKKIGRAMDRTTAAILGGKVADMKMMHGIRRPTKKE